MRVQASTLLLCALLLAAACQQEPRDSAAPSSAIDSDGDSILDCQEGESWDDADGDGTPNHLDLDADDDGISDADEAGDDDPMTWPVDSDSDHLPDFLDADSDDNGLPDQDEARPLDGHPRDSDGDGWADYRDPDNDGDGIADADELGDDPQDPLDTDGDGQDDHLDTESDGDAITDFWEGGAVDFAPTPVDSDDDGTPDFQDEDSDDDGLSDLEEGGVEQEGAEPRDTDGDGSYDFRDADSDDDGLADAEELALGTDPLAADTDGDGQGDRAETELGSDPLDANSRYQGILIVVPARRDVTRSIALQASVSVADVVILLDTTQSMGPTLDALVAEFGTLVSELDQAIPNLAFGFATFDDYNYDTDQYGTLGSGLDKPFELRQQVTTDSSLVQAALDETRNHFGEDWPESTMEALYQGIKGAGYDQDCDGVYYGLQDVLPFLASKDDPFGGTAGESYDASTPGGGQRGGFGFRDTAWAFLVYATDAELRDPEVQDKHSVQKYQSPHGCPVDAGASYVVDALADLGGSLIGISVDGDSAVPQMEDLAERTGSYADLNGDGLADDPLVFTWEGKDADLRSTIVSAVVDAADSLWFDQAELVLSGDEQGFVIDISPTVLKDLDWSEGQAELSFDMTLRGVVAAADEDQLFTMTLQVYGDQSVLLGSYEVSVLVLARE